MRCYALYNLRMNLRQCFLPLCAFSLPNHQQQCQQKQAEPVAGGNHFVEEDHFNVLPQGKQRGRASRRGLCRPRLGRGGGGQEGAGGRRPRVWSGEQAKSQQAAKVKIDCLLPETLVASECLFFISCTDAASMCCEIIWYLVRKMASPNSPSVGGMCWPLLKNTCLLWCWCQYLRSRFCHNIVPSVFYVEKVKHFSHLNFLQCISHKVLIC